MATAAMRILVVDDYPDSVEAVSMLLELDGYEVLTASDGAKAVDLAASFRPDLALLDIGMPSLDGYAAAREIRRLPLTPTPYLVAVTGFGRLTDKRSAGEAGFDLHLRKPVEGETYRELLALLQESKGARTASRVLAERNHAVATDLIVEQVGMAGVYLDTLPNITDEDEQKRHVAYATLVHDRVVGWLGRGACSEARSTECFSVVRALKDRLLALDKKRRS